MADCGPIFPEENVLRTESHYFVIRDSSAFFIHPCFIQFALYILYTFLFSGVLICFVNQLFLVHLLDIY